MRPMVHNLSTGTTVLLTAGVATASPTLAIPVVGDIRACYNCSDNFGSVGVVDGPTFLIENTSGSPITGGLFEADIGGSTQDIFHVGTIGSGASVIVEPGVSTDGFSHTGFFSFLSGVLDTSDSGPSDGATKFEFTGLLGPLPVDSGIFTPAMTAGPSPDGTILSENFLGGGPQSDGPCNDCFGPKIIATLSTPNPTATAIPEPWTLALFGAGLAGLGAMFRRRRKWA
jgi:hypothetical protein